MAADASDHTVQWSTEPPPPAPPSLEAYAGERGLTWKTARKIPAFSCLFEPEDEFNLNSMAGVLPGGRFGAMGHRLIHKERSFGAGDGRMRIEEAWTFAAVRAGETKTTLVAINLRSAQLAVDEDYGVELKTEGLDSGWRLSVHERTDRALLDELLAGEVGGWVRQNLGWGPKPDRLRGPLPGGQLDVRAGMVSLWIPGYVTDPAQLDRLATETTRLAESIRDLCRPHTDPGQFAAPLPAPAAWVSKTNKKFDTLGKAVTKYDAPRGFSRADELGAAVVDAGSSEYGPVNGVRDFARTYAGKRGLELEDGRSFDRAFPTLPVTGWTQAAWRGTLRDGSPYRLAVTTQRPYAFRPEHTSGSTLAVVEAPGLPDAEPSFLPEDACWIASSGGLLAVWQQFRSMGADQEMLDRVVEVLQRAR